MKVGDYVRTDNGIDKVSNYRYESEYENGHVIWFEKSDSGCRYTDKDLPKSSSNIIDLIEVGDVIRYEIETSMETNGILKGVEDITDEEMLENLKKNKAFHIKSIVTKEQFSSMEYKVD